MHHAEVVKRDNTKEPYSEEKVRRVVEAAGLDPNQSVVFAQAITNWLLEAEKSIINSLELRDKVLAELRSTDENAANLFEWYQKTKGDVNE